MTIKRTFCICIAALTAASVPAAVPANEQGNLQTDQWFDRNTYSREDEPDLDFDLPSLTRDASENRDYDYDAVDPHEELFDFDWLETAQDPRVEYPLISPAPPDGETAQQKRATRHGAQGWSDKELARRIELKLAQNESVPEHAIDVRVNRGVVTLTGSVSNYAAKRAATHAAAAVRGVAEIENGLSIRTSQVDDKLLAGRVRAAISESGAAELNDIEVKARDGRVTLEGTVQSFQERLVADEAAAGVRGVQSVHNLLALEFNEVRPDAEVEADIESRLAWDSLVDDNSIEVEVQNGVVRLSGSTDSAWEKRRAVMDSWVAGVQRVEAQQLTVQPVTEEQREQFTARSEPGNSEASGGAAQAQRGQHAESNTKERNQQLEHAVRTTCQGTVGLKDDAIAVEANRGLVTLTGKVDTLFERSEASRAAASVQGVRRVYNNLKVRPANSPNSGSTTRNVLAAIERDAFLEESEINVLVRNGKVWLSGTVDNRFERTHARNVVARVKGVMEIQNNLRIESADDPLASQGVARWYASDHWAQSDAEIEDEIEEEMFWSPFVDANEVGLSVLQGKATLVGIVDSLAEKAAAEENAYEGGATSVDNRLIIGDPGLL